MAYRIRYRTRVRWTRLTNAAFAFAIAAGTLYLGFSCLETAGELLRTQEWYLPLARLAGSFIRGSA